MTKNLGIITIAANDVKAHYANTQVSHCGRQCGNCAYHTKRHAIFCRARGIRSPPLPCIGLYRTSLIS